MSGGGAIVLNSIDIKNTFTFSHLADDFIQSN